MRYSAAGLSSLLVAASLGAQGMPAPPAGADSATRVTVSGFVDVYYAYDGNRPPSLDRLLTTTAARHNEFNVNLAFVDAVLAGPRTRGRIALQFGTAVQANYAGEPHVGAISGPQVSQFVQEATAGYEVVPSLWIDAGVMLAPFGGESWISRDNPTYTRSLAADLSPYYESGVRATWQATPRLGLQAHLTNGWQNISETNSGKAVAVRVDYAVSPAFAVAYDVFLGNEQPDSAAAEARIYHEVIVHFPVSSRIQVMAMGVRGVQQRAMSEPATWAGGVVTATYALSARMAGTVRVESYRDAAQVIATGTAGPLDARGGSVTLDFRPSGRLLVRGEVRALHNRTPLFPTSRARGALRHGDEGIVLSAALTL